MKKDLNKGQHFLINLKVIEKEVKVAEISKEDGVIEIGAGEGNLTKELVKKSKEVLAFEIDKRFFEKLNTLEKNNKNLKIICDDALNYSWKNYTKIVSNIPYFISEQVINKSINDGIKELTLIVGEKFKEKLRQRSSMVGIISNLFYDIKFIMKVDKKSFSPEPRVNSWLIKMTKKKNFSKIDSLLISIIRRKSKLKNSIIYSLIGLGKTKRESKEIIKNMKSLDESVLEKRAFKINKKVFLSLEKELKKLEI